MPSARPAPVALLLCCCVAATAAADAPPAGFSVRTHVDAAGPHRYTVFVPNAPPPAAGYPVVLFLHGAAERGTDGVQPTTAGLGPVVRARVRATGDFPAVVVFPQVEDPDGRILTAWHPAEPDGRRALAILAEVEALLPTDPNRRLLTGWSMGGYGVAAQLAHGPKNADGTPRWSAAVSVAGGLTDRVDPAALAAASRAAPLLVYAGDRDRFVPPAQTAALVDAVRKCGGAVTFTTVPDAGHDVWKTAFNSAEFRALLRREPTAAADGDRIAARFVSTDFDSAEDAAADVPEEPFVPTLLLDRAAFVRADNGLLGRLSQRAVAAVPPDALAGVIGSQSSTQRVGPADVRLRLDGIRYSTRLAGASVRGGDGNVLTVRLELADLRLSVGRIAFSAPLGHRGTAGPVCVRAGVRRTIPLEVDVRPEVRDGKISLTPLATRFDLPADDYFVAGPCRVDEDGLFLTEAGLARRIVEGLYEARPRIEREVRNAAPRVVKELESRLDLGGPGGLAGELTPLPAVEGNVRVRPEAVRADAGGLTVQFGLAFGALPAVGGTTDGAARSTGPVRADGGVTLDAAAGAAGPGEVAVGISTELVRHLTGALVSGGLPKIDTRDVPGDPLRELGRRATLVRVVPGLAAFPEDELRARLTLTGPVLARSTNDDPAAATLDLFTEGVELTIDRRPPEAGYGVEPWRTAATVRLGVRQRVRIAVRKTGGSRALDARAAGGSLVRPLSAETGEGVDGPVDAALAASLVGVGWDRWVAGEGPFAGPLEDLDVLGAKLRAEGLTATRPAGGPPGGVLIGRFAVPETTLQNRSASALTYRVRNDAGGPWGGPFTLAPGATHSYRAGGLLRFEQLKPAPREVTARPLPAGTTFAFRPSVGGAAPVLVP